VRFHGLYLAPQGKESSVCFQEGSSHQAQFIHVACADAPSHTIKRGALAPLTRTAIGWMLLSRLSDQEVARLCTRVNASEAPDKRVSPSWLTDQIQAVRDNGYALSSAP